MNVADYLINRLRQTGLEHVFGVAGDYVLDFMDRIVASPLKLIGTCNELNAGYAADGYARAKGIGCAVVTYGVGGLSIANAVAGAYAERVPMVIISGAPHSKMRLNHVLMHHLVADYHTQLDIFGKMTAAAVMLADGASAGRQIDEALSACMAMKRPVYIELPVDVVNQPCGEGPGLSPAGLPSDAQALAEAADEAAAMLNAAKTPAVLLGVEIKRFDLSGRTSDLLEKAGYPFAATINGKTAVAETHPHYVGVYQGGFCPGAAHDTVESADCLLSLGAWMTDITTGGFTAHLDQSRMISANSDRVRVRHHYYDGVRLGDFVAELTRRLRPADPAGHPHTPVPYLPAGKFVAQADSPMTVRRFFGRLNHFLTDEMTVVSDTGDVMFGASELHRNEVNSYIAQDYYLSIGYSLPAALGAALARPDKRVINIIGDGAFQMTGQELSSLIRFNARAVVFVLNNQGYVIERLIHDGPYNEVQNWNYHRLPEAFGGGIGTLARTEGELEASLELAEKNPDKTVLIEVQVGRNDSTDALAHIGQIIRKLSN
ncbi:MAG: alpha-keto acid decarboxylase family protein [Planctomycetes bacterium]|nr:alpha-keto acid decarboxylase family protein [Planctomycetota bacterium]